MIMTLLFSKGSSFLTEKYFLHMYIFAVKKKKIDRKSIYSF